MSLVTADDLCLALEATVGGHLWPLVQSMGLDEGDAKLKPVTTWDQVPVLDALTSARVPVGAITSPGLVDQPTRRSGRVDARWRLVVGMWDRDSSHRATAARVRLWAGLLRTVVLQHPTLGGIADSTTWVTEFYDEIPDRSAARTLGSCAVAFDVLVRDVVDLTPPPEGGAPAPTVQSTHQMVSVRPPSSEE